MKVVVTGGAGFIGSHLVDELVRQGYETHVIDNGASRSAYNTERSNYRAEYHLVDITDFDAVEDIMTGAKYVFHLAALPRVQYSIENPKETFNTNVVGTQFVLEAARNAGVKRVVFASSSSVYGMSEKLPLCEDDHTDPVSPYGAQKLMCEIMCRNYFLTYGLEAVSLRYFNVYGPRLDPEGDYALVMGVFLKQKKAGLPSTVTGNGTQTRDFTQVRDVVSANLLAAASGNVGHGEVINIGFGRSTAIITLASLFGGRVEYIEKRKEPHYTLADNTKAKEMLGWKPEVFLEKGVEELNEWYL